MLITGIKVVDKDAVIVSDIKKCDVAVMQWGWTRSKFAVEEWNTARRFATVKEGYLYTKKYKGHLN